MRAMVLKMIEKYISRWHNKAAQYIGTFPIIGLFLDMERRPGSQALMRWWDQEGVALPVILIKGKEDVDEYKKKEGGGRG